MARGSLHLRAIKQPLHGLWKHLQRELIPMLREEIGESGEQDKKFVGFIALLPLEAIAAHYAWQNLGCTPESRLWMLNALLAKEVHGFPHPQGPR